MATYDLKAGVLLGRRFRINRKLGSGTFGTVYHATQEVNLGPNRTGLEFRDVALKIFKDTYVNIGNAAEVFHEAVVMERLVSSARSRGENPHVVEVYDIGVFEELWLPYVAMELLEGGTLDSLLQKKVPLVSDAVEMLREICSALRIAHAQGIFHRDLKPNNILFTKGNFLKVTDFGLAIDRLEAYRQLGQAGTISYSPPDRGPASGAFDVYSMGVMLVEFLLKRNPLAAVLDRRTMELEKAQELLAELRDPLRGRLDDDLRELRDDQTLQDILRSCLAVHPSRRFPNAAALDEALEMWQQKRPLARRGTATPAIRTCEDLLKSIEAHRTLNDRQSWVADLQEAARRCKSSDARISYEWSRWHEAHDRWSDAARYVEEGMSREGRRSAEMLCRLAVLEDKAGRKLHADDLRDEARKAAVKR